MFLPFFSGLLLYASYPPISFWPLAFISLVPLFVFLARENKFSRIFWGSLLFRATFGVSFVSFLPDPFLVVDNLFFWMGFPATVWLTKKLLSKEGLLLPALAINFTIWEYLGASLSPLPAYLSLVGNNLADTPFLGLSALGGPIALTLFISLINAFLALLFMVLKKNNFVVKNNFKWDPSPYILPIALLLVGFMLGASLLKREQQATQMLKIATVAVSAGFDSEAELYDNKVFVNALNIEKTRAHVSSLLGPIEKELHDKSYDLIIFPEAMIDLQLLGNINKEAYDKLDIASGGILLNAYSKIARDFQANVLANFTTFDKEGNKFNSSIVIDRNGNFVAIYKKHHLALGGEYWPFGKWVPPYWNFKLKKLPPQTTEEEFIVHNPTRQYKKGDGLNVLPIESGYFGAPICLEGQIPSVMKSMKKEGGKFLVNASSNQWLREPNQVYFDVVENLRRVEMVWLGIPMVVSEKNGYAGIIYPNGVFEKASPDPTKKFVIFSVKIKY